MAEVLLGGAWLHELGTVGDVRWSSRWGEDGCGPDLASCTVAVDPANDTSRLRIGTTFEVWSQGVKVFGGVLSEMGRDFPRSLAARGWVHRGGDFDAVDSAGEPTANPNTAVSAAIGNGLPWSGGGGFTDAALGTEENPSTTRLNDLLSKWAVATGNRWGVDANGVAFVTTDPTSPTWFLDASDLDIGVADDGLFTRVRARYVSGVDADGNATAWSTVTAEDPAGQALYGVIEYPMDLTGLGLLTGATALGYAQRQRDLLTVPQWLSRVTTNPIRLLSSGGLPAHLPSVRAGQMVRLFNVPNNLGGLRGELALDVVLGQVEYDASNPTEVTIAPVGLAVRNLADLAAQAARTATAA